MQKRNKSPYCLNCGKVLLDADNYCPNCGQENDNKRQSIGKLLLELITKFLHFDSKIAHSIPALLFRPGYLTAEYLRGKRQRHLDPVKMFITIILAFFILSHLGGDENHIPAKITYNTPDSSAVDSVVTVTPYRLKVSRKNPDGSRDSLHRVSEELTLDISHYSELKEMVGRGKKNTSEIMDSLNIENTIWNRVYYTGVIKFAAMDYAEFKDYLVAKAPWIVFSLIPVFAFLLKILYVRRKLLYIDHLIFAFHLHAFVFFAGCIHILLDLITGYDFGTIFLLIYLVYALLAFKNFYKQSWFKTILKSILLMGIYLVASFFSFFIMMFIIFLIY